MAYRDLDREPGNGRIILIGALVALLGLGAIVWLALTNPGLQYALGIAPEQRARRALLADPVEGLLYATIQRTYPAEFDELGAMVVDAADSKTSDADRDKSIQSFLRDGVHEHRLEILRAPDAQVTAYRRAELHALDVRTAENPGQCARDAMDSATPDLRSSPRQRAAGIDFFIAAWTAAAAGRDHGVARNFAAIDPKDDKALLGALRAGRIPDDEFAILTRPASAAVADAAKRCAVGMRLLHAIDTLPEAQANRLYLTMLAHNRS